MRDGSVSSEMASTRRADAAVDPGQAVAAGRAQRVWVERLQLTNFRNYASLSLSVGPGPVVLTGANGTGKTNLLEAVSLLTSGQGLRRAPYPELARMGATGWTVAARLNTPLGALDIGTGLAEGAADGAQVAARAASCASTGRRNRAPARWPTMSRWSGSSRPWTACSPARHLSGAASSTGSSPPCIRATDPCSDSSSGPCSSATGCWPTTYVTAPASRRSSG